MSDIQKALREEISRLARKEVKSEIESLKKSSSQQRSAIAGLRRQIEGLERQLKQLAKQVTSGKPASNAQDAVEAQGEPSRRFSAKRLAAHRAKLGLSAAAYGRLVNVSGQTIYNWEQGAARPRPAQLQALVAVRGVRRSAADALLAEQTEEAAG